MIDGDILLSENMPLVIGVTGHRHLPAEDLPELEREIDRALGWIRERAPTAPLKVLSALAEGADRLVADRLLKQGVRLQVVLPFPQSEYERDFEDRDSLSEFRSLLNRADSVVELDGARSDDSGGGYREVGRFISNHATILFGLWDGENEKGVGGAAEIIRWHRQGGRSYQREPLVDAGHGYVIHIPVRRRNTGQSAHPEPGRWRVLPDEPGARQEFELEAILRRIEAFHADLRDPDKMKAVSGKGIQEGSGKAGIIDAAFTAVDGLSQHYQQCIGRIRRALFILVYLGVVAFAICAHHIVHGRIEVLVFLALYLICLGRAYYLYLRFGKADPIPLLGWLPRMSCEDRHLDYRVIAEYLRVFRFWRTGGVTDRVEDYLPLYGQGVLDWVVFPLKSLALVSVGDATGSDPTGVSEARWQAVRQAWIEDQLAYFTQAHDRHLHGRHRLHRLTQMLLALSLVGVALLLALYWTDRGEIWSGMAHNWLVTFISLSALGSAMAHAYGDKRGDLDHARQAQRMRLLFLRASELAKTTSEPGERRVLLQHLGREAVNEVANWLLLRRSRPVEVPKAG